MGRMSAYTGKRVTWEQALNSKETLTPPEIKFGKMEVAKVAIPGRRVTSTDPQRLQRIVPSR